MRPKDLQASLPFLPRSHPQHRPQTRPPISPGVSCAHTPSPSGWGVGNHVVSPKNVFAYLLRQKVWAGRGLSDRLHPCRSGRTSAPILYLYRYQAFFTPCTLKSDPNPSSHKPRRFLRTYTLALRMGCGETMWFPRKMFLHTFCAKKYGPVAA